MSANKKTTLKTFSGWTSFDVEERLGFINQQNIPELVDWLQVDGVIPNKWNEFIEARRLELFSFQNFWNETELLSYFISPLLVTVDFRGEGFNHFSERPLQAEIGPFTVNGFVDLMIATGKAEPETPFFFLHEYKKIKGTDADPLGQLLIEMVAVQKLNGWTTEPVYGCYVLGKFWHFVLLVGKTYSVSQGFDATDPEELTRIWLVLNKTKAIIAEKALVIWKAKMASYGRLNEI